MPIVPFYAALLALVFFALSVRTILARNNFKVLLGDAGNAAMQRAIRVHANFAEYVPITLLLLYFVEQYAAPLWLVHVLAIMLIAGRLIHAYGVSQSPEKIQLRQIGMVMTFVSMVGAALCLLLTYF